MNKFVNTVLKCASYIVFVIFGIVVSYLLLLSVFSTSYVSTSVFPDLEFVYNRADNPWLHIAFILLLSTAGWAVIHFVSHLSGFFSVLNRLSRYIPIVILVCGTMWILCTCLMPVADQWGIVEAATLFNHNDFSWMEKGQYLAIYPNQLACTMFIYYLIRICGENNYIFLQFINVISLAAIAYLFRKFTFELIKSERQATITYYIILLFMPLFMYIAFIYGTLPGLALTLLAFYLLLRHIEKNSPVRLAIAVICVVAAVFIKQNYSIALIAFAIILALHTLKTRKLSSFILLLFIIPVYLLASFTVNSSVKKVTGITPDKGFPKTCWISMGLQECATKAPGWYNDYSPDLYAENGMDYDKTNAAAMEDIRTRLDELVSHPRDGINFFARKTASQWNNPTFQCFWIYIRAVHVNENYLHHTDFTDKVIGFGEDSAFNKGIINLLNVIQTFILFGSLLYCIYFTKKAASEGSMQYLLLPVFFIGGFFFHLIWEAKSQYTMPYFVTLIPLAVIGFKSFACELHQAVTEKKLLSRPVIVLAVLIIIVFLIAVLPLGINSDLFKITNNADMYNSTLWN